MTPPDASSRARLRAWIAEHPGEAITVRRARRVAPMPRRTAANYLQEAERRGLLVLVRRGDGRTPTEWCVLPPHLPPAVRSDP